MDQKSITGRLIALVGPKKSGKSTIQNILEKDYGFVYRPIRKMDTYVSSDVMSPEMYRNMTMPDRTSIWRDYIRRYLEQGGNVVIDDCTTTIEHDAVKDLQGIVWRVYKIGYREDLIEYLDEEARQIPGRVFTNDLSLGLDQLSLKVGRALRT